MAHYNAKTYNKAFDFYYGDARVPEPSSFRIYLIAMVFFLCLAYIILVSLTNRVGTRSQRCYLSLHKLSLSFSVISRSTLQGFPTAITYGGISLVTTEPAPMIAPSPMVTPGHTVTFAPSQTQSPITMGLLLKQPAYRSSLSMAWLVQIKEQPGPIKALCPISILFESNKVQLKFKNA